MRNAFVSELLVQARKDERIILLTGDLGYSVLEEFQQALPKQFINLGINEQSSISIAAGMAKQGFKPFYYSIGNFPTFRCLEQIRNDVCFMDLGVCIVALGAGFAYGTLGYSHHLVEDLSALRSISNLRIYSPFDPNDTKEITAKICESSRPTYLRLGRGGETKLSDHFPLEKNLNLNQNYSGTIIFTGNIGAEAYEARDKLADLGIKVQIASISNLSDISRENLERILKIGPVLTLEEHVLAGGFGSLILEKANELTTNYRIDRVGIKGIISHLAGSQEFLIRNYELNADALVKKYLNIIK